MTIEERNEIFEQLVQTQREVLNRKAHDYTDDDVLSSFKLPAEVIKVSPVAIGLSMVALKVHRLGNLLSNNKDPKNESIEDNIIDLANYTLLLLCLIKEKDTK